MGLGRVSDLEKEAAEIFKAHYDLGERFSVVELHGGYINKTFLVEVSGENANDQYIIRKYNPLTANEGDINFEHTLLKYLKAQGFTLTPDVYSNKFGGSSVEIKEEGNGSVFWAVFECLKGDVKYAFYDTGLNSAELSNSASTLACLNHAGRDFYKTFGIQRSHPKILDYVPTFPQHYAQYVEKAGQGPFGEHFLAHLDAILEKVKQVTVHDDGLATLPLVAIHGDFHQGNLTFVGDEVVGVFDFDWTRIDLRLFDLAQAIIYFCAIWEGDNAGTLDFDKVTTFLKSYNDAHLLDGTKGELSDVEKSKFSLMLEIANLFVLHCMICFFYETDDSVEEEYIVGLMQYTSMMKWLGTKREVIDEVVQKACK